MIPISIQLMWRGHMQPSKTNTSFKPDQTNNGADATNTDGLLLIHLCPEGTPSFVQHPPNYRQATHLKFGKDKYRCTIWPQRFRVVSLVESTMRVPCLPVRPATLFEALSGLWMVSQLTNVSAAPLYPRDWCAWCLGPSVAEKNPV